MDKITAEKQMNKWGKEKTPFFFIINFDMNENVVIKLSDLKNHNIKYSVNECFNPKINKKVVFQPYPISFAEYKKMFEQVQREIKNGNTYLLNLTYETPIKTNLNLNEIYQYSQAKYKLYFEDKFVCFSPEIFVKIENGKIYSFPMKGTIDANIPNAEKIILTDSKETAEHATIVDLIRNDLSIISGKVKVEKYRFITKLNTNKGNLLQVSSKISGYLPKNYSEQIGTLIFKLLPAGSISGAPKEKTVEIIHKVENYNRDFYTGVFGVFDGKDLNSAVMIRFIEKRNKQMYFKSGGGITINSNAQSEYNELIQKVYLSL